MVKKNLTLSLVIIIAISIGLFILIFLAQTFMTRKTSNTKTNTIGNIEPTSAEMPGKYIFGIATGGKINGFTKDKLELYFSKLNELGVGWIRWDIEWFYVQNDSKDSFNWDESDRIVALAEKYNIKSVATLAYAPKWAAAESCSYTDCYPADPSAFGKFAEEAARRYKGKINVYEIWNEPNSNVFWKNPNPQIYGEILKESYTRIKSVDPNIEVLTGGLAAIEDSKRGSISPVGFLESLYEEGVNKYFDSIALHPYTYPIAPNFPFINNHFREMEKIRKLMIKNGDENKKIWITEIGAPTGGPGYASGLDKLIGFKYGSDYMEEEAQAEILQDSVLYYKENTDFIAGYFWYSLLDEGSSRGDTENFYGLLKHDWSEKLGYSLYKDLISQ